MKRSLKNVICIVLILIMATMTYLTINYAKGHVNNNNEIGNFETPPEKPSGDNEQGNPPEKPRGDNEQGNPPEKPTNNKSNQTQNANINYVYYMYIICSIIYIDGRGSTPRHSKGEKKYVE